MQIRLETMCSEPNPSEFSKSCPSFGSLLKVYDNNTLRVNSLINSSQFITHISRTRLYKDALLQSSEDLEASAHFNSTTQFVIEKIGALSTDKTTGEICVISSW
jgi:hypothetical protein